MTRSRDVAQFGSVSRRDGKVAQVCESRRSEKPSGFSKPGRGVAQFGSALPWGGRGRTFESCRPDQVFPPVNGFEKVRHAFVLAQTDSLKWRSLVARPENREGRTFESCRPDQVFYSSKLFRKSPPRLCACTNRSRSFVEQFGSASRESGRSHVRIVSPRPGLFTPVNVFEKVHYAFVLAQTDSPKWRSLVARFHGVGSRRSRRVKRDGKVARSNRVAPTRFLTPVNGFEKVRHAFVLAQTDSPKWRSLVARPENREGRTFESCRPDQVLVGLSTKL